MVSHASVYSGGKPRHSVCHIREGVYLCLCNTEASDSVFAMSALRLSKEPRLPCDWWMWEGFRLPTLQSILNTAFCSILLIFFVSFSSRNIVKPDGTLPRDTFQGMQASQPWATPRNPCPSLPGKRFVTPYRIPIIPSVHSHQDETSCMQTTSADATNQSLTHQGGTGGRVDDSLGNPVCHRLSTKWKEDTRVPEVAREKLKANANMKLDDATFPNSYAAKETVCILLDNGNGHGGAAPSGPTETQILNPRDMQKDSPQPRQWGVLYRTSWTSLQRIPSKSINGSLRRSENQSNTLMPETLRSSFFCLFCFWKRDSL